MSDMIARIAAEADRQGPKPDTGFPWRRRKEARTDEVPVQELPAHQFGACSSPPVAESTKDDEPSAEEAQKVAQMVDACDEPPRGLRTGAANLSRQDGGDVAALLSIECLTGRLPSLLGREFFRAKVTSYTVVTSRIG